MFILIQLNPVVNILEAILTLVERWLPEVGGDDDEALEFTKQFLNLLPRNAQGQRVFFQPRTGV